MLGPVVAFGTKFSKLDRTPLIFAKTETCVRPLRLLIEGLALFVWPVGDITGSGCSLLPPRVLVKMRSSGIFHAFG